MSLSLAEDFFEKFLYIFMALWKPFLGCRLGNPTQVPTYYRVGPDPDYAFKQMIDPLKPGEITYREDCMKRCLRARCKSLLEVHEESSHGRRVDFLYRTV